MEIEEPYEAPEDLPNLRLRDSEFDEEEDSYEERPGQVASADSHASQYHLPDVVKNFILYFHRHLVGRNVYEVHSIYENSFIKLTEKFFKNSPWPPVEVVAPLVENGRNLFSPADANAAGQLQMPRS
jgi:translation initiation factor 3 subunit L